jgi:hypothetical protein
MRFTSLSGDAASQLPRVKPSSDDGLIISPVSDWEKAVMHGSTEYEKHDFHVFLDDLKGKMSRQGN